MNRTESNQVYDVVIVGAGISGANAAYILKKRCKDLKILIIEAKHRCGGRTETIELMCSKENQTSVWDIGGQWVSNSQKNVTKLLNELNIETYLQSCEGKNTLEADKKIATYSSTTACSSWFSWLDMQLYMKRVNRYIDNVSTIFPFEHSKQAAHLDGKTLRDFLYSKCLTPTVRAVIKSNMKAIYGLELEQVNNLFGLMYVKSGGGKLETIIYATEGCAQERKVKNGTQQISGKCIDYVLSNHSSEEKKAKVLYNTALIHVVQNDEKDPVELITQNTITGERTTFRAVKVISSIPINQYINVKFTPELPYYKRNFFKFCQIGNYLKFVVTYKTPFWREKGLSGQGSYDSSAMWLNEKRFAEHYKDSIGKLSFNKRMPTVGCVTEVFDNTNEQGEPALVGFVAGASLVEWADQSDELRKREILEDLVRFFGDEARDYVDYVEKNWSYEPYNGGCPSFSVVSSGAMEDYPRATREPFLNVHFCGTESATVWQGYMDGAVESGERVANEVLYALFGNNKSIHIDYEKTWYHHKELIKTMIEKDKEANSNGEKTCLGKKIAKYSLILAGSYVSVKLLSNRLLRS